MTTEQIKPHFHRVLFGFGIINPLTAVPQLHNVWVLERVGGISAITTTAALAMAVLWTVYGLLERRTVLWATSVLWIVMHAATLVGIAFAA